jgi:hypothetical protein
MTSREELLALHEWMREPDWAENFSLEDMKDWINARPTNITARLADGAVAQAPPTRAEVVTALKAAQRNFMATGADRESDERYNDMTDSIFNLFRPASAWRPIETIPISDAKDDDHNLVLVWVADARPPRMSTGYATISEWSKKVSIHANGFSGRWNYTHWMPLPSAPETTASSTPRCPTCNMTDAGYSVYIEGWYRDPWHSDNHLRGQTK